jgi:uncharacterized protein (DUF433 family)
MNADIITSGSDILGGTAVFAGTRVPVRLLFEHLKAGDSLDLFLTDFPSVRRELAVAILDEAQASLIADAHPA